MDDDYDYEGDDDLCRDDDDLDMEDPLDMDGDHQTGLESVYGPDE